MKVRLVARVSTTHQDAEKDMKRLRQWAKSNNHIIIEEFWIHESARKPISERSEFKKLLEVPKGDALVLTKLDRLTRDYGSVHSLIEYFKKHWDTYKLIAIDHHVDLTNATGEMLARHILNFACYESALMIERQKPGIEKAIAEGKYPGRKKGALGKKKYNAEMQS